jgi:hypothetical protein
MSKRWNPWAFLALFLPSTAVLGIHAYLGSFNRFIADDYCSAYISGRLGLVRSVWFWYKTWFGRYAASAMDSILPIIGTRGIAYSVLVILIFWVLVTIAAVAVLCPIKTISADRYFTAGSFGAAIIYVTLLISPNVPQSLYWWNGMRSYIPPLLFGTLYVVLYQLFMVKPRSWKEQCLWGSISFLVLFIGGGFSESFTPVQVVFLGFILSFGLLSRKFNFRSSISLFLLTGLAGAITALLVMVLAPGNTLRQAFFPASHPILTILSISFSGYFAFLRDIVGTLDKISGLAAIAGAATWLGLGTVPKHVNKSWLAPAILFAGFVLAFGCFPPSAYGLSDVPPARALIIPACFLVISLVISSFFFGQWLSPHLKSTPELSLNSGFFIIVLALMVFSTWTSGQALFSSRQNYIDYARQWDQMNAHILQAKAAGDQLVFIPNMTNWAGLDNPNNNPKFWLNVCYSKYYDIDVLTPAIDE